MPQTDVLNIFLGFLEGLALIISPCILPILPIMLSSSLASGKKRPLGIVLGFVIVFALFTFFSRALVRSTGIDLNIIRYISYGLLLLLGLVMISTRLTEKFTFLTQRLTKVGSNAFNDPNGGFVSGLLFGSLIAIIWTPCAGPILAAVIVQTVLQQTNWVSFLIVLAFGVGAAVPMLFIILFGRSLMQRMQFFKTHAVALRKILGVIVIASVIYMLYGENTTLANAAPATEFTSATTLENALSTPYPAPTIGGIDAWINSPPLQLDQLKGKVVLIDFWTYSCINCIRTLPYLKDWYNKYHDKGLVIIGIHTPEFEFEKNVKNVEAAVKKFGILYPVGLDSQFVTWRNFENQYWPAHYLIDKNGSVVYQHFGEGEYDVTENNIRTLLNVKNIPMSQPENSSISFSQTPETYLGYARADHFISPEPVKHNQSVIYSYPAELPDDGWALQGGWAINADKIISTQPFAEIKLHFNAKYVYMVMGSVNQKPITVSVLLNGEKLSAGQGSDVHNGQMIVDKNRLYEVVALPRSGNGIVRIIASEPGLEIYTFTFGG